MILDQINKAAIDALKNKDVNARKILSILKTKVAVLEIAKRSTDETITEADIVSILQKTSKELDEEFAMFEKMNKAEEMQVAKLQKSLVESFLPEMLKKEEIAKIIAEQDDKSMPNIMKHFKTNYAGKVNMKDVQEVLKTFA